jgi:hypothetical protein
MNVIRNLRAWWQNTHDMPFMLRMFCQGAMVVTPFFALTLVFPIFPWYEVNGRPMSYAHLWSSGVAPAMLAELVLVGTGCWGLAARNRASRWLLVLTPIFGLAVIIPFDLLENSLDGFDMVEMTVEGIVGALVIYFCLFHISSADAYMARTPGNAAHVPKWSKTRKTLVAVFVVAVAGIIVTGLLGIQNSASYKLLEPAVLGSGEIAGSLGAAKAVHLQQSSWSMGDNGNSPWAEYNLVVEGATAMGKLHVRMEENSGSWTINKAELDGKPIDLRLSPAGK